MGILDKKLSLRDRNKMLIGVWEDEDQLMAGASEIAFTSTIFTRLIQYMVWIVSSVHVEANWPVSLFSVL